MSNRMSGYSFVFPRFCGCVVLFLLVAFCLLAMNASVVAATFYVDASRSDDSGAGTNWATAKQTIQGGVDLTVDGDVVWVTNGIYNAGGMITPRNALTNRVCITNTITVQSVNGPEVTIIEGAAGSNGSNDVDSVRGVFMNNGATLDGFTVRGGYTMASGSADYDQAGGGLWLTSGCVVVDCVLTANSAWDDAGGAYLFFGGALNNCVLSDNSAHAGCGGALLWNGGEMNNCLLVGNRARGDGGGVYLSNAGTVNNCTLSGNTGNYGGGVYIYGAGVMNNCVSWGNTAVWSGNDIYTGGTIRNTCASDGVSSGSNGCITNNPLFKDVANTNYTLLTGSPCIDAGNNGYAPTNVSPYDLAGNLRILGTAVDMGAYEADLVYVDANEGDDGNDGRSWGAAKKTIQAGVDAATSGATVWVSNGVYNAGGVAGPGDALTNRVCITNAITVRSVNGPAVTIIEGAPGSNGSNDLDSVRGVYMTNGCMLAGFTVRNGYTIETWSNMDGMGGGLLVYTNCLASNCVITGNSAVNRGGGAYMYYGGKITHSMIKHNTSRSGSGGVHAGTVGYSVIVSNRADSNSGGAESAALNNCVISYNVANNSGGGALGGSIQNCLVAYNQSGEHAGGVSYASLANCTVYGNSTVGYGGGLHNGVALNCIVWGNSAGTANNIYNVGATNTCASDGVTNGVNGCVTGDPLFVDAVTGNFRLRGGSPCIDAGDSAFAPTNVSPYDLDGNLRVMGSAVDMGAYEADYAYVDAGSGSDLNDGRSWGTAKQTIQAAVDLVGEGATVMVSNGVYATGTRVTPGLSLLNRLCITNAITVCSVNGPDVTSIVGQGPLGGSAVRGVFMTNGCSLIGFAMTNGYTATTGSYNIEECGAGLWAATNCLVSNCVFRGNTANERGGGSYGGVVADCDYYENRADIGGGAYDGKLDSCTLSNNYVRYSGGGASHGTLTNCIIRGNQSGQNGGGVGHMVLENSVVSGNIASNGGGGVYFGTANRSLIIGNSATNYGGGTIYATVNNCRLVNNSSVGFGGGAQGGTLRNCVLKGNASWSGGGVYDSSLYNCTMSDNGAAYGGGAQNARIYNCIVWGNTGTNGVDLYNCVVNDSCASDGVTNGVNGCITDNPVFMDATATSFALRAGSPCINAGSNAYAQTNQVPDDLAGNARVIFGTVDMGAYESTAAVFPANGPSEGLSIITITNATALGNGSDITGATVCGVAASVVSMGTNWVVLQLGSGPAGGTTGDISVQSTSEGTTTISAGYTYNPAGEITTVTPSSCSVTGFCTVVISGTNLGNGSDIYSITLCGVSVDTKVSQSSTQVVVIANASLRAKVGDVVVKSTSYGTTTATNAFTYTKRVPLDFDGDGIADIGCYYPDGGEWFVFMSRTMSLWTTTYGGGAGTTQISGFFDADDICDYGTYYPPSGLWQIHYSGGGGKTNNFGFADTVAITGYFDDDQITDFGCYYAPNGGWFIFKSKTQSLWVNNFGFAGTSPVTGDFDGDGITDFGCYYPPDGSWIIYMSKTSDIWTTQFGYASTVPVTGDFDGDGICDFGCYDASGGYWFIFKSQTQELWVNTFGFAGTTPVVGDYDGDAVDDFGCYYPPMGGWYIYKSSTGFWTTQFGFEGTEAVQ